MEFLFGDLIWGDSIIQIMKGMNVFLQMRSILEVVSLDFLIHLADVMGKHQENPGILEKKQKRFLTNFDIVISDEGSMGRSFVFYPGNAECMTEEELNIEYISNSSYFYMANLDSVTKKAAQMAKQKGSKIFMDADSYTDELLDAISWIDIFIGSEFVYEKMLEAGKSVKENCEYLYNKGPEIVIFTFGEKGCAGISKEGFFEIPAFDVDVKDD